MQAARFVVLVSAIAIMPLIAFPKSAPCSNESVLVTVVNQKGIPVRGLREANFRAKLHRKPLQIMSVTAWSGPVRVLLLFDVSGSMWNWIPLEKKIGAQIISGAEPKTSFAIAMFSSHIDRSVPFTGGVGAVTKEISALDSVARGVPKNDRKTAIFDAIKEGLSMFGKSRPGDVICLVTDGSENHSQPLMQELNRSLSANGIRVYAILLMAHDNNIMAHIDELPGPRDIHELTKRSGGMTDMLWTRFYWDSRRWSSSLMESALALCPLLNLQFGNGYIIRALLPSGLKKPEGWKLEIIGLDGKVNPNLSTLYPHLSPCQIAP